MSKRLDYNQIAPAGVKALGGVYGYVMQSSLPAVLVDLVYLRISQINNCAYCLDMHIRGARARRSHYRDQPDECLQPHGDQFPQYAASCDREGRLTDPKNFACNRSSA